MGINNAILWPILLGVTLPAAYYLFNSSARNKTSDQYFEDGDDQYHPLLKDHSSVRSYTTAIAHYPSVRTFYRPHPHKEKLQAIADLPLLVFVHGLGGVLPQFCPLLGSLVSVAPCFGLELPGHGRSAFQLTDYKAYTIEASAALWKTAIEEICDLRGHKQVVLIGHSMGCSLAALLATDPEFKPDVAGIVAVCPKGSPPSQSQVKSVRMFLSLPNLVLDILRRFDRRGGEDSSSVRRFVGEGAGTDMKKLQLKYNKKFRTPVWKRFTMGILPVYDSSGQAHGGLPGRGTWSKIRTPLYLVAGEADVVTKAGEINDIVSYLQHVPVANGPSITTASTNSSEPSTERHTSDNLILKTTILPRPASHALLYDHNTYRILAGLISDFLSTHITPTLSLAWQLQHLTTSGKWDVKNLEKWQRTPAVSMPITSNLFRALKTLRQQDSEHTPKKFVDTWKSEIYALIDISHDTPIYDTHELESGGIQYHKFPTVSKIPPTSSEVRDFIQLVERLRMEMEAKGEGGKAIGVHCHYGFNRTGFLICCALVEKRGMGVEEAMEEFRRQRPPGIRHGHFVDTLFVRYCVGLRKGSGL